MTSTLQDARIQTLNHKDILEKRAYVLYWMQASQRAEDNYALAYAISQANQLDKPLLVAFGLMDDYPEANVRHYTFMLEGLAETQVSLKDRHIKMVVQHGSPDDVAIKLGQSACLVVTDRGYLKIQRQWRNNVAHQLSCQLVQIEDNVVVPVELVSNKAEYAARTIRPKIIKHLETFLVDLQPARLNQSSLKLSIDSLDLSDPVKVAADLKLDKSVAAVSHFFKGGTTEAKRILGSFLADHFHDYDDHRNQPQSSDVSHMSKYLHFGQISPLYIALHIRASKATQSNIESYLEELIVRRELAINFTHYCPDYNNYNCLPDWAKKTLEDHKDDTREFIYSRDDLESAQTHDDYWNAAMNEMRVTGYMHNYMRMYWGKKIIEWTPTPQMAFQSALYLNNKYFLDGRDPNSFAGVAWCFGLHDRAWKERAIFGKIRYMNANGLKRKAKPDVYVEKVKHMMALAENKDLLGP